MEPFASSEVLLDACGRTRHVRSVNDDDVAVFDEIVNVNPIIVPAKVWTRIDPQHPLPVTCSSCSTCYMQLVFNLLHATRVQPISGPQNKNIQSTTLNLQVRKRKASTAKGKEAMDEDNTTSKRRQTYDVADFGPAYKPNPRQHRGESSRHGGGH